MGDQQRVETDSERPVSSGLAWYFPVSQPRQHRRVQAAASPRSTAASHPPVQPLPQPSSGPRWSLPPR